MNPECKYILTFTTIKNSSCALTIQQQPTGVAEHPVSSSIGKQSQLAADVGNVAETHDGPRGNRFVRQPARSAAVAMGDDLPANEAVKSTVHLTHGLANLGLVGLTEPGEDDTVQARFAVVLCLMLE